MPKINLVTIVGHNTTMLPHMINHYKNIVDEIHVVVYRQSEDDGILDEITKLGLVPIKVVTEPKFNWEKVTQLYNEIKHLSIIIELDILLNLLSNLVIMNNLF